ncbi:hypothetical protein C8Q75DRAFT_749593 [Abortiporus biennis]|nr:hypothetical protein C8Q75DRAFT_749593 [Abortiporus biennis]
MSDTAQAVIPLLSRALHRIRSTPPRIIASPATQPRRAAVALIIRVSPPPSLPSSSAPPPLPTTLTEFFAQDWVNAPGARPEILFLRRDKPNVTSDGGRVNSNSSGSHVAFPGGRTEEGDEGGLYTAMRQTWEEIGLDLAENAYTAVGQLDDREITTSLGKRLLMILSPFVFLQLTPHTTPVDPTPGTRLHWVPLAELLPDSVLPDNGFDRGSQSRRPRWSEVTVDASSRLAPRHSTILRLLMRLLVGSMRFPAIIIDTSYPTVPVSSSTVSLDAFDIDQKRAVIEDGYKGLHERHQRSTPKQRIQSGQHEELKLWGLSLGMTLDLLAYMVPSAPAVAHMNDVAMSLRGSLIPPYLKGDNMGVPAMAPSLTSVFPRFSYPDVNFWIWVFGKRYREVVRSWEASIRAGGTNDRRINWTGSALSTFYAAVRKALVVVIVFRAIVLLLSLVVGGWFFLSK